MREVNSDRWRSRAWRWGPVLAYSFLENRLIAFPTIGQPVSVCGYGVFGYAPNRPLPSAETSFDNVDRPKQSLQVLVSRSQAGVLLVVVIAIQGWKKSRSRPLFSVTSAYVDARDQIPQVALSAKDVHAKRRLVLWTASSTT